MTNIIHQEYKNWLTEIKSKIRSTQIKAAITVNTALIEFYWDLGKMIADKQSQSKWGDKILEKLSKDLNLEFPGIKGLSKTNLKYCKSFFLFYDSALQIGQQAVDQNQEPLKWQQTVAKNENAKTEQQSDIHTIPQLVLQIPWGHNIYIFTKSKGLDEALFYVKETISNNWSRDVLALQIKSDLYQRQGKAINNFKDTLPTPQSDLANETLKDPYVFDFLTLAQPFKEKEIEDQLVQHVTNFLLELGKGFAFIGKQYHIEIADNDYYLDLLFYHVVLKCYVVIELKNTKFRPEYAGKMNFYLSAVDSLLKKENDNPTLGILLCRDKNNIEAEFALRDINKPMGVSEFQFTEVVPDSLKSSLPSIEELENELLIE